MPRFKYDGLDKSGNPVSGEAEAVSAYALIQALREAGKLAPTVVPLDSPPQLRRAERPLGLDDLNQFTEQLAALTQSGMPLAPALAELARSVRGRRFRRLLEEARFAVEGGHTLEDVFNRQGNAFPPLYVSLIRVGERTGNLLGALQQLSAYGQRHVWLRQRLLVAAAYPVFLLVALLLFLGLFVTQVIGQFGEMYAQFGAELPPLTHGVLLAGQYTARYGYPALGLLGALSIATWLVLGRAPLGSFARRVWEGLLLRCPGVGPSYQAILSARFFRALGMLLENGAPIVESLHLAGMATGSSRFAVASVRAAARVAQGESVGEALGDTGVLRRTELWMMKQGEALGDFPAALTRLADLCDREAANRQQTTLATVGPVLVTLCGILVGLSVVACFLPIFQFATLVHG